MGDNRHRQFVTHGQSW